MSDEKITYRAIRDRCESVAKEIVNDLTDFGKAKESNTWDSWQVYLDDLEIVEEEAHGYAYESVDSWDWSIYTGYGMDICQAVMYDDLCDAESEYADIWGGEAPDGLYKYASRLGYLILVRMLSEDIRKEVETCRELAEELQANCEES